MKYDPIENLLFKKNRIKFLAKMDSNSIAVFNSNDNYPVSADTTLPFEQHRDLFYLTGINQEKTVLILATTGSELNEFLFITKPNETMMHWEGKKLNHESAYEISGINNVFWVDDLEMKVDELMLSVTTIYVNNNEHYRANVETETREERFNKWIKNKYSKKIFKKSNPILQRLRAVKEQIEIDLIKKACSITEKGFRRILKFVKPGVWEYEIEAEFSHEFLINRSRKFAYSPIIASGNNSNVLHYIDNNQQCKKGDLLLLDVGAEYANYSSDMTRTIPVSGKFNKRQRDHSTQ